MSKRKRLYNITITSIRTTIETIIGNATVIIIATFTVVDYASVAVTVAFKVTVRVTVPE